MPKWRCALKKKEPLSWGFGKGAAGCKSKESKLTWPASKLSKTSFESMIPRT